LDFNPQSFVYSTKRILEQNVIFLTTYIREKVMETTKQIRNTSFYSNSTKKQFENCLLPLWIYGEGTTQEIADTLKLPINEVVGRFNECAEIGLIHIHTSRPTKLNKRTLKQNTNFILTAFGKETVKNTMAFKNELQKAV